MLFFWAQHTGCSISLVWCLRGHIYGMLAWVYRNDAGAIWKLVRRRYWWKSTVSIFISLLFNRSKKSCCFFTWLCSVDQYWVSLLRSLCWFNWRWRQTHTHNLPFLYLDRRRNVCINIRMKECVVIRAFQVSLLQG
jgi:hypothetical protein